MRIIRRQSGVLGDFLGLRLDLRAGDAADSAGRDPLKEPALRCGILLQFPPLSAPHDEPAGSFLQRKKKSATGRRSVANTSPTMSASRIAHTTQIPRARSVSSRKNRR